MEEADVQDPEMSDIPSHDQQANIHPQEIGEGEDRDDNGSHEVFDMVANIQPANDASLFEPGPRDINNPPVVLPSLGQVVGGGLEGRHFQGSDYQLAGGECVQMLANQHPRATQRGGNLVADLAPSFSTFIVCYCAVLATLILSSANDA